MNEPRIQVFMQLNADPAADPEILDAMSAELLQDLQELGSCVQAERVPERDVPNGAKGLSVDVRTILIKLAEFGGITAIVNVLGTWLARDKRRSLKLQLDNNSLEVTGLSEQEQADLIEWFKVQAGVRLAS